MAQLAQVLGVMGDAALTAFIIYQILDTIEWLVFFGLCTWGARSVWKAWVKHEWADR